MTREEVIKGLSCCQRIGGCGAGCPYNKTDADNCRRDLLSDALKLLESGRESEIKTEVLYKILNREDLLSAFHEYVYAQVDFYMNYTGREESTETARTCMSEICGAAVLMNNILNPRKEESNAD